MHASDRLPRAFGERLRQRLARAGLTDLARIVGLDREELRRRAALDDDELWLILDWYPRPEGLVTQSPGAAAPAPSDEPETPIYPGILDRPIDDLDFAVRTIDQLRALGIGNVRELVTTPAWRLARARVLPRQLWEDFHEILAELGLDLDMDLPPSP